ncbi:hypothetical protein [Sphingobium sp.]|uniref:hypothetical protein n=1 Tax=Sphingobium sp. TaxID=1912891 RepID=UPI002580746E|nr:hypothetical protein [Sphingobium sp.]MBR2267388.1 hypothetical protein [Sphingobium sp.]
MTQTDHNTGSSPSLTEHAADGQGRDDAGVLLAPFSFGEEGSKNRRKRRFFLCLSQVEPLSIRWPVHPVRTKTPPGP